MLRSRYQLLQPGAGAGGQATIDLYFDRDLERKVAVKTLHAGAEPRRLLDEITALGKLQSNNVVQVFDVDIERTTSGTTVSLVQEYIDGDELSTFIGSHVSLYAALRLLFQLASALVDVHEAGVTHRDVKLSNIKVDREGVLKLYDFGLARFSTNQSTVGLIGTPGYMAPELRRLGHVPFTNAVDVFAFACTAWCLLQEETDPSYEPESAGYDFKIIDISENLADALNAALASDPVKRPTMSAIRDLLHRELTHRKHRAKVIASAQEGTLDDSQRSVALPAGNLGGCEITYDGHDFWLTLKHGDVFVNNVPVMGKRQLSGSVLITLGGIEHGARREFVTFDVSHPEVAL